MNTSSFFYTQHWLSHLDGYTPEDIQQAILQSTPEVPFGERLRMVAEEFLDAMNTEIKNHNSFGILKLMGQTTEYVHSLSNPVRNILFYFRRETLHQFNPVSGKTIKKYALTLHHLVFGILHQLDPSYSHTYHYPLLHESQLLPLQDLKKALDDKKPMSNLVILF